MRKAIIYFISLLASYFISEPSIANNKLNELFSPPVFVCPPCAHVDDVFKTKHYKHDGQCPVCGMNLIELYAPSCPSSDFHMGSGNVCFKSQRGTNIPIFYHIPKSFSAGTKVLLVLPGAGRNAWRYRDTWIQASEKYNVMILSPHYSEKQYPEFWSYNLANMISDVTINPSRTAIDSYKIVQNDKQWIFSDFDRIFDLAVNKLNLTAKSYDMFGHSAGGQILHRYAIFANHSKANRILSSNSGWYTVTTDAAPFPYGLNGLTHDATQLSKSLKKKLVLFLGDLDDDNETRGHLVRNPELDVQGTNRVDRGKYFYQQAKQYAKKSDLQYGWKLHIVEGIGHDYVNMGKAAARYLYHNDRED